MHFLHLDVKKYFDQTNSSMFFVFFVRKTKVKLTPNKSTFQMTFFSLIKNKSLYTIGSSCSRKAVLRGKHHICSGDHV